MKKIEAIFDPSEVEALRCSLSSLGISAMTVAEVKGFGAPGPIQVYRGVRYQPPFLMEAKVEFLASDEMVDRAVALMRETVKKDAAGQSRISVYGVEDTRGVRATRTAAA